MAGITFELKKLTTGPSLFGGLSAYVHSAIIVAGPWIFTVLAIAFITIASEHYLGLEALANFRIVLIYGFSISLAATAPIVIIVTRMLSDMIFAGVYSAGSRLLLVALVGAAVTATLSAYLAYAHVFAVATKVLPGALYCVMITAMIWITLVFCSAIKDFLGITSGFLIGLVVGVFLGYKATQLGYGTQGLTWSFNIGLSLTLFVLLARVLVTFPHPMTRLGQALKMALSATFCHRVLALGALASVLGLWVDKWVWWGSSRGELLPVGLTHAPSYDSAMFVANLAIIPGLAAFVLHLETGFFTQFKSFSRNIESHAPLKGINARASELQAVTLRLLGQVLLLETCICVVAIWFSPTIADQLNLQYQQIAILRIGILGAIFHFMFLACSSLLLFLNQSRKYTYLQFAFLGLNGGLTYLTTQVSSDFIGYGYMFAALLCSLLALHRLYRELQQLPYTIFTMSAIRSAEGAWLKALEHT